MQKSFSELYSSYYDLIYKDKDYYKEASQIDLLIRKFCPGAKKILNIGCGTGNHDQHLVKLGYQITGLDISDSMLDIAQKKRTPLDAASLRYICTDIKDFTTEKQRYDVAISLFHVTSYHTTDDGLQDAFQNIYDSLKEGGLFIFDFWHTPGILTDLPETRTRVFEENHVQLERHSEPEISLRSRLVKIKFSLKIKDIRNETFYLTHETHLVRYFKIDELAEKLKISGFEILGYGNDYELNPLNQKDRYATIVAKK